MCYVLKPSLQNNRETKREFSLVCILYSGILKDNILKGRLLIMIVSPIV